MKEVWLEVLFDHKIICAFIQNSWKLNKIGKLVLANMTKYILVLFLNSECMLVSLIYSFLLQLTVGQPHYGAEGNLTCTAQRNLSAQVILRVIGARRMQWANHLGPKSKQRSFDSADTWGAFNSL